MTRLCLPLAAGVSGTALAAAIAAASADESHPPIVVEPVTGVSATLSAMSLDEKLSLVDGGGRSDAACVGATPAIPRLHVPALCMGDGPAGVGNGLHDVTMFPAPISIAASWDPALAQAYGAAQAEEQSGKGRNVALLPTINILRDPRWGRAAETLGEDPFLTATLGVAIIHGIQSRHVIAMPKHFAVNNQETDRFGDGPDWTAIDARVGERALHEIYLPAFHAAVTAGGAQSIMCAYNRVNGHYACENAELLGTLRRDWGFDGFVTSDWLFAGRSTVPAIRAGLDQLMPGGANPYGFADFFGSPLRKALQDGAVTGPQLDGMVRHILNAIARVGVASSAPGADRADVRSPAHLQLARLLASSGIVLLRNEHTALPIGTGVRTIAVIGPGGANQAQNTETYGGFVPPDPHHPAETPLQAIQAHADGRRVIYEPGSVGVQPLAAIPASEITDGLRVAGWTVSYFHNDIGNGTPIHAEAHVMAEPDAAMLARYGASSARWQGVLEPRASGEYRFAVTGGGAASLRIDGQPIASFGKEEFNTSAQGGVLLTAGKAVHVDLLYNPHSAVFKPQISLGWAEPSGLLAHAVAAAKTADLAVVFANDVVSEGGDRTSLALPGDQDRLIEAVAAANPRTVVVLNTVGAVLTPWRSKVAAILEDWYNGEESGSALTAILFGDSDPAGHLPETFPADSSQGATAGHAERFPGVDLASHYHEGLAVGYRWYDATDASPAYPFGFGLSYTDFSLSDLHVGADRSVSALVRNVGRRDGSTVVQLYLDHPAGSGEPSALKAFDRVTLAPGQSTRVKFGIRKDALVVWDEAAHRWSTPPGRYVIHVGFSSRDLPLQSKFDMR